MQEPRPRGATDGAEQLGRTMARGRRGPKSIPSIGIGWGDGIRSFTWMLRSVTFWTITCRERLPGISKRAGARRGPSEKSEAKVKPIARNAEPDEQADAAKQGDGLSEKREAKVNPIARNAERSEQADAAKYRDDLQNLHSRRRARKRESQHLGYCCSHYFLTFVHPRQWVGVHKL
jgi:hypothetical protein